MIQTVLVCLAVAGAGDPAPKETVDSIEIPSALVTLIEQVDVPAREAGVLETVDARPGQLVDEGELLAQIFDTEARTAQQRAKIEVQIAEKAMTNDVHIRFAKKSVEVARAELQRSLDSVEQYPKSISDSELDRLRLVVQRAELEVEQAEHEFEIAEFTRQIRENEYRAADEKVQRRKVAAPIGGVVVDVYRHRGEWVEPGDVVLRILRINQLRAEGFLDVELAREDLNGADVRLLVDSPDGPAAEFFGKIVFISPEIDPVNAQVRVWAEVENRGRGLRPGMRARMIVRRPTKTP